MYVVARSLSQGYLAGFVSALGLSVGVLVHVLAAVIGLSTLLVSSATAFTLVKYIGAAYLIYLGIQAILSKTESGTLRVLNRQPLLRLFADGVIVSVFNPKIALFFLSFLPQFVAPEAESATHQIVILGFVYAALALVTDSAYAMAAGLVREHLGGGISRSPAVRYIAGSLLIGLGLKSARPTSTSRSTVSPAPASPFQGLAY